MEKKRITVILSAEEYEQVRTKAGLVPLSTWFRNLAIRSDTVMAELADARPRRVSKVEVVQGRVAEVSGNHEPERTQPLAGSSPAHRTKTCEHGKPKGYNCWQCGGTAVME